MAEEAPADIRAIASPTDVKREPNPMDGLDDLNMSSLVSAYKRSLEETGDAADDDANDAKRLKTEAAPADDDPLFEFDVSMLVQNALSNFDDELSGHTNPPSDVVPTTEPAPAVGDMLRLDSVPPVAVESRPTRVVSYGSDPERFVREANLNALASMTISMLVIATQQPLDALIPKFQDPRSDLAQTVCKLKTALEGAKNIYSPDPVLRPDTIELHDADARTILQLANIAQLGAWIMEGSIESMRQGDKYILPMLQDREGGLSRSAIEVWTGIKTHLAMDSLLEKPDELSSEQILRPIFSDSVKQRLAERRSDPQFKEQRANDITAALKARQDEVQETILPDGGLLTAQAKYTLDDILKPFGIYAREQLSLASHVADRLGIAIPAAEMSHEPIPAVMEEPVHEPISVPADDPVELNMDDLDNFGLDDLFEKQTSGLVESALASFLAQETEAAEAAAAAAAAAATPALNGDNELAHLQAAVDGDGMKTDAAPASQTNGSLMTDYKELEALVAESTSNYVRTTLQGLSPAPYQPVVPVSTAESMAAAQSQQYLNHAQNQNNHNPYYSSFQQAMPEVQQEQPASENLPPNQTASSSDLYDKARQAALSKTTSHTRREGSHSTRRPWSQEEEKALMAGLDMVKGPHWSQILTLFGVNGTISDILKDRTQVQLKDKARNLKLFFLKTNSEMPFYLQAVTGELKTRAPTQAARKEAEERARLNSEEDQAKLQGIMALAGGLQHPPQNRASGSPAAGNTNGNTVAQANTAAAANQHSHNHHPHAHPQMTPTQAQTAGQNRPALQAVSQKPAQAATQPQNRPQNQFPPQVPRPQTHAQPNSHLHHTNSNQATTQGAVQRSLQHNGAQQGAQQSPQPSHAQQTSQHPVLHKIQHQVQQRMAAQAAQAAGNAQAAAQRQQFSQGATSTATTTQTSAQAAGHMQQQPRPQPQQVQSKPQSPAMPNAQANTHMQQAGVNRTAQSGSPNIARAAVQGSAQSPTTAQRPTPAPTQGQPHSTTQSAQATRPANALHLPTPQPAQQVKTQAPLALPKPAIPQQVSAPTQPNQPAQPNQQAQGHTAQPQPPPAQTVQRQSPQSYASQPQPLHAQKPQAPGAQQPTQHQSPPQAQASPNQPSQTQAVQQIPQQFHQTQPAPSQAAHTHPAPAQYLQAQQTPAQPAANQTSPTPPVQQQSPPQPQAAQMTRIEQTEVNDVDDDEMSPEARLLQGLRDAMAGTASFDGSTESSLPQ